MNKVILMSLLAFFVATNCFAQSSEEKAIQEAIIGFAKAGDINDAEKLASYLDDNYRVVMNRLFGSSEVTVMSRETYLEKIKTKEYGGDKRKVEVESIIVNGTTASAKVSFVGAKMTFVSSLTLIEDANNQWKLVSEVPIVK